jgi:hypothetical protein
MRKEVIWIDTTFVLSPFSLYRTFQYVNNFVKRNCVKSFRKIFCESALCARAIFGGNFMLI